MKQPRALFIRLLVLLLTMHICLTAFNERNRKSKFHVYTPIDPRLVKSEKTQMLALKQTVYARNLMYYPNNYLTSSFKGVAANLVKFMETLDPNLLKALGARILNQEGILPDSKGVDLIASVERLTLTNPTVNDRLVCVALLGDIGAMFSDTGATTGTYGRTDAQADSLREKFKDFSRNLNKGTDYFTDEIIKKIKNERGSKAVGPKKAKERFRSSSEARSGIFNYGEKADEILGIEKSQRIIKTAWDVGIIEEDRLNVSEPWAGHMSGSPSEILHVWDALSEENPLASYTDSNRRNLKSVKRTAKGAAASAFLVAMGYHSAMECIEGIFAYLGQDFRSAGFISKDQDAGHLLQNGESTGLMLNLFREMTRHDKIFDFTE